MPDDDQPADSDTPVGGVTDAVQDATGDGFLGAVELPNGQELPVTVDDQVAEAIRENDDVSMDDVRAAAASADIENWAITADTRRDDTATVPVMDDRQSDLSHNIRGNDETAYINDPQIRKLIDNSVTYSERVGQFLLEEDDLIPAVKERLKALITGEDGLDVEPSDPDNEADQRLTDHLQDVYGDDVMPGDVIDRILTENLMSARAVLRATDLAELDLGTLTYYRDGITGEEVYVQDRTTVYEFDIEEPSDADGNGDIDLNQRTVDKQPLVIGDQVFDISLYDHPPLKAVADTAVNKMVLQRLKARKAEIASFGAVYASVSPPSYLPEDQYFDRVKDDDFDGDGTPPTKLERALKQNIQSAFDTLKDFQNGTVMSVPESWELQQLEVPETGEPLDDQIRGYNRDIARRMLVPLDLIELREGSELSRETLFQTLMTTIAGWRREILRVFDQFADTQADIHDLNGSVEHSFPPLEQANTKQVISALQHAGVAGLSEREVRQMLNTIQGVDLTVQDDGVQDAPPAGGPDDDGDRGDQMAQFLDDQNQRGRQDAQGDADAGPDRTSPSGQPGGVDDDQGAVGGGVAAADIDLTPPQAAQENAQQVLDWRDDDEKDVQGMTDVGWRRARQLADGGELTPEVVKKMSQFNRHRQNAQVGDEHEGTPWRDAGHVAWLGWGGDEGIDWAMRMSDRLQEADAADAPACVVNADAFTPPEGLDLYELDGWDQTSVWQAFISLGGQQSTCSTRMSGELRNPDAWCAALKDQALGTDLWRSGSASAQPVEASQFQDRIQAQDFTIETDGSLSDAADTVSSVLSDNGADVTRLMEQDDFVAFNLGDADPTDEDTDGSFEPVVVIDAGEDAVQVTGLSRGDDLLDGLDERLNAQAVAADWNPADHPRGPDGKFTSGPGGSLMDVAERLADLSPDADAWQPESNATDGDIVRFEMPDGDTKVGVVQKDNMSGIAVEDTGGETHEWDPLAMMRQMMGKDPEITHVAEHPDGPKDDGGNGDADAGMSVEERLAELPDIPEVSDEGDGIEVPDDAVDTGYYDRDPQPLQDALASGSMLGVGFDGETITDSDDMGPWKRETEMGDFDGQKYATTRVWMSPDEFLRLQANIGTGDNPDVSVDEWVSAARPEDVNQLSDVMSGEDDPRGGGVPMPGVELDAQGRPTGFQEGRHRALAALDAGLDRIPVAFSLNTSKGDAEATDAVAASHGFSGYETLREATQYVRGLVEQRLDDGQTVEMRKKSSDRFALLVRDRGGNFQGSMVVTRSSTDDDDWLVTGTSDLFEDVSQSGNFRSLDAAVELDPVDPSLGDRLRAGLRKTIGVGGTPLDPQDEGERDAYRDGLTD